MGKIITPKYRVVVESNTRETFTWRAKQQGKPNAANLQKFVDTYQASFNLINGANRHITVALGFIPTITHARIEDNVTFDCTPNVYAQWNK